jgi:hypothetical protein
MKTEKKERDLIYIGGDVLMTNQQAYRKSFIGEMNAMKKDKTRVEKENVNKNVDITQTKEFWSTLAVIS